MQIDNYCLLYYFLGEAKNDYTAAIVGGSIAGVILILCISALGYVMYLRLRKIGSRNLSSSWMRWHVTFTWTFFNHVLTSMKKTPSCEAIKWKKGRIYEVDSFQVLVFKLVSILVYVVVLNTLIICFQQLPLRSLHWTLGWTTCYKRFSRSLLELKTFGLYRAILHWLVKEQTGLSAGKYVWANHICFAFVTDWLKLWREYDFTSNHRARNLKTKTLWHK